MKFVMETSSILETGDKIVLAPLFLDFGIDVHFTFVNLL